MNNNGLKNATLKYGVWTIKTRQTLKVIILRKIKIKIRGVSKIHPKNFIFKN